MKRKFSLRRTAALALSGLLGLAALWPGLSADASVINVDGTDFVWPDKPVQYVYYWYEGLPPSNSATVMKTYPVLLTWADKYYFKADAQFAKDCAEHIDYSRGKKYWGWSNSSKDSGKTNGNFGADGSFPCGYYRQNMAYDPGYLVNMTAFNYLHLINNGAAISFTCPKVPEIMPLNYTDPSSKNPMYALVVNYEAGEVGSGTPSAYWVDGGFRVGQNFIGAARYDYYRVTTWGPWDWDDYHTNKWHWSLYGLNDTVVNQFGSWFRRTNGFNVNKFKDRTGIYANENIAQTVGWEVIKNGDKYCFWQKGFRMDDKGSRISHSFSDDDEQEILLSRDPAIALAGLVTNNKTALVSWGDLRDSGEKTSGGGFKCYYAQPVEMTFMKSNFNVVNGQVINLDGPVAIEHGVTATVKEGGTLVIKNWAINNGTIIVEEGGTLYIQDNSCLNRINDGTNNGGGIISNGLVIVGEGSKLIGGGPDGIQLLEGSHVVNFGCVASENFIIQNPYTVENRGSGFVLYGKGNGVTGTGAATQAKPAENGRFAERGAVEKTISTGPDDIAPNAVYSN